MIEDNNRQTPGPSQRRMASAQIWKTEAGKSVHEVDVVAVEEPLEIKLAFGPFENRENQTLSITMRTPGEDYELALGFLLAEGILRNQDEILSQQQTRQPSNGDNACNEIQVDLKPDVTFDLARLERHFYSTSSCGVCGRTSLDFLKLASPFTFEEGQPTVARETVSGLDASLRERQTVFSKTGGLHAAALFDTDGTLLSVREDVGRHNAVDKLLGAEFLAGRVPLRDRIMLVSGRTSFEILQKALMAGVPIVAAVGAPSSLAVSVAKEFGMTLLGFVREGRFNVYAGERRISAT